MPSRHPPAISTIALASEVRSSGVRRSARSRHVSGSASVFNGASLASDADMPAPDGEANCVYVLRSESQPRRFYTGVTSNLARRLSAHNRGDSVHTAMGRPWRVVVAMTFSDAARARAFEEYLKSGSGRAFANRHFR
jgi:putative endonuclease